MRIPVLSAGLVRLAMCGVGALSPALATNWYVSAGQSLQQVLNEAALGDTITLQAGATFTGNFRLAKKTGSGWITIQSSLMAALPPAAQHASERAQEVLARNPSAARGRSPVVGPQGRVSPSHAPYMAKLVAPNNSAVLSTEEGAHHYRITGLELTVAPGVYTYNVVQLGTGNEISESQLPHSIEFDRVYIHGDPVTGGKRGITMNSRYTTVANSYISGFKSTWQETQAIGGWNGTGPYELVNNFIEAAGVNVLFGGAKANIPNLVAADIVVRNNHFFKPLTWKQGSPEYAGVPYVVKNLFELKNARRVTITGNVFENNWPHSQDGFAILFTVRTENGAMPWATIEDVVFSNNIVRNVEQGINMLGKDGNRGVLGGTLRHVTIWNNLFERVNGRWVQLLHACDYTTIDHNTVFHKTLLISLDGAPSQGLVYRNNISARGTYGIFGSGKGEGIMGLAAYAPGSVVTKNVIAGSSAPVYPPNNYFPSSIYDVRFVDTFAGQYALAADSPYRRAGTDGKDLGVDFPAVDAATAGVVSQH